MTKMNKFYYFALLTVCILGYVCATNTVEMEIQQSKASYNLSFASYFGDHMVLQAAPRKAVIWGYAPSDQKNRIVRIFVSLENKTYTAPVSVHSTWSVMIGPLMVGGPHSITASLGDNHVTIKDVLFGDVWVCSGQSNMQFTMSDVFNSTAELKDSLNYQDIRVFTVKDYISTTPVTDLSRNNIILPWSLPSPATLGDGTYFSAVCWLYGKYLYQTLKKPIGLLETSWGGTPVEAWSSADALKKCGLEPSHQKLNEDVPLEDIIEGPQGYTLLWNAMVHPLLKMTIYGAIWYQGENNANFNRDLYNCTFPAMIDDWRKKFHASSDTDHLFPFGFVQLAPMDPNYSADNGFSAIRWHQTADYGYVPNHRLRNVFMAVAMDLPDFTSPHGSIHPRDKQDVSARLALGGLAVAYGRKVSFQGPYPVRVIITQEEPYNYTQVEAEYTMNLQQRWLDGFEICCSYVTPAVCEPGKSWWLPTSTIQAYDRENITQTYASECSVEKLVGLRYAWKESPCPLKKCAIYGQDNSLPLPPFSYFGEQFYKTMVKDGQYVVTFP